MTQQHRFWSGTVVTTRNSKCREANCTTKSVRTLAPSPSLDRGLIFFRVEERSKGADTEDERSQRVRQLARSCFRHVPPRPDTVPLRSIPDLVYSRFVLAENSSFPSPKHSGSACRRWRLFEALNFLLSCIVQYLTSGLIQNDSSFRAYLE